jgi:hypothetical protein
VVRGKWFEVKDLNYLAKDAPEYVITIQRNLDMYCAKYDRLNFYIPV